MPHTEKKKILIIENDLKIQKQLLDRSLLRWDAVCTAYKAEGIAMLKAEKFDLLILDLAPPDVFETELIKKIQENRVKTIIAPKYLASFVGGEMAISSLDAILGGPFTVSGINEVVEKVLV